MVDILKAEKQVYDDAAKREHDANRNGRFDSREDDYSAGRNASEYDESENQSRFTSEEDYPEGDIEKYDEQRNERHFTGQDEYSDKSRAYDRSSDYSRERDDDAPFINQDGDAFYDKKQGYTPSSDQSGRFASHNSDSYFTGDQGYRTKQDIEGRKSASSKPVVTRK